MSRPYFNINSMSYTSPVLTMNYSFYKLRSATPNSRTLTITGFSNSISFVETHNSCDFSGLTSETLTFSVPTLGTSSTTTYTPSTYGIVFGGTPSTSTNVILSLQGSNLGSFTASGSVLSTYLTSIATGLAFSGVNSGFTASVSGSTLTITAPKNTGTIYNNTAVTLAVVIGSGGSTLTYSAATSLTGGVNIHTPVLSYGPLGFTDNIVFNTTGTNI